MFLTDRRLLAEQAFGDFKDKRVEDFNTFTEIYKVSSLKDVLPDAEARLHFATVQGLVRRLFYNNDENENRFLLTLMIVLLLMKHIEGIILIVN